MTDSIFIHPSAEVSEEATIGNGTRIWHQAQVMPGASIGENCNLGKGVYIDSNVSIGSGVKIQNGVSVFRGVTIESHCFVGPHAVFTNDLIPRAFNTNFTITETLVCKGASIGANATIVCGVTLGKYCMIAAGSLVTKDIEAHSLVIGSPAIHYSYICKCGMKIKDGKTMSCPSCI